MLFKATHSPYSGLATRRMFLRQLCETLNNIAWHTVNSLWNIFSRTGRRIFLFFFKNTFHGPVFTARLGLSLTIKPLVVRSTNNHFLWQIETSTRVFDFHGTQPNTATTTTQMLDRITLRFRIKVRFSDALYLYQKEYTLDLLCLKIYTWTRKAKHSSISAILNILEGRWHLNNASTNQR